ncbi:MAG TPA: thiol-disulfide oxidoreductase DCC family protein [Chthoniobacterales bacterium]
MTERPVILFDGVCNLCDGFVQFVIRHDTSAQFRFASLQSEAGAEILKKHQLPANQLSTVVLSVGDGFYMKSDAALHILRRLSGAWRLAGLFLVLPRFIRDSAYDLVAKNRYRLFGEKDACMLPTPELRERFL